MDISKLKKGDRVKFRCGGEAEVMSEPYDPHSEPRYGEKPLDIAVIFNEIEYEYMKDGRFCVHDGSTSPFDIVEIIPAPFNWDDVKAGMCFYCDGHGYHCNVYFVLNERVAGLTFSVPDNARPQMLDLRYLTRAPEEDIIV